MRTNSAAGCIGGYVPLEPTTSSGYEGICWAPAMPGAEIAFPGPICSWLCCSFDRETGLDSPL